jgi:hypothetical protein
MSPLIPLHKVRQTCHNFPGRAIPDRIVFMEPLYTDNPVEPRGIASIFSPVLQPLSVERRRAM